ncbi:hypothetical protein JG687_00016716 [Phytophthora cactorum]|uniref:Uncharacterized protein n=1 Tax=Phytophthora cactorum TaxID=29920 RepID=A0A8T1TPZ5_9STRA|nr:hypothetical protein JG687_00016716 [Phytophthora cactorum]
MLNITHERVYTQTIIGGRSKPTAESVWLAGVKSRTRYFSRPSARAISSPGICEVLTTAA